MKHWWTFLGPQEFWIHTYTYLHSELKHPTRAPWETFVASIDGLLALAMPHTLQRDMIEGYKPMEHHFKDHPELHDAPVLPAYQALERTYMKAEQEALTQQVLAHTPEKNETLKHKKRI